MRDIARIRVFYRRYMVIFVLVCQGEAYAGEKKKQNTEWMD